MNIERVVVLGAGTMGHGIAQVAAQAGCRAALFDVDAGRRPAGPRRRSQANLEKGVDAGQGRSRRARRDPRPDHRRDADLAAAVAAGRPRRRGRARAHRAQAVDLRDPRRAPRPPTRSSRRTPRRCPSPRSPRRAARRARRRHALLQSRAHS